MTDEEEQQEHTVVFDGRVLPDVWRIGPVYYNISVEADMDELGITDPDKGEVKFSTSLTGEKAKVTALHEAIHAMMFTYMPGYTNINTGLTWKRSDITEAVPYHLGPAMLGFMRDNPSWVVYLMEGVFYGIAVPRVGEEAEDEEGDTPMHGGLPGDRGYL